MTSGRKKKEKDKNFTIIFPANSKGLGEAMIFIVGTIGTISTIWTWMDLDCPFQPIITFPTKHLQFNCGEDGEHRG